MNGSELDFWRGSWRACWEVGEGTNTISREFDDKGSYFALSGGREGDTFVLRMSTVRSGAPVELRMVFCDIEADSFRWVWERSTDAGETRTIGWEIAYTRTA